jgi:cell division protein FtsX
VGLALAVAGGVTAGWFAEGPAAEVAAPACQPTSATAFLHDTGTGELRTQVHDILARSPEVQSLTFETREQAFERFRAQFSDAPDLVAATRAESLPESWRFKLRCAGDFPAVKERLGGLTGVDLLCICELELRATRTGATS